MEVIVTKLPGPVVKHLENVNGTDSVRNILERADISLDYGEGRRAHVRVDGKTVDDLDSSIAYFSTSSPVSVVVSAENKGGRL